MAITALTVSSVSAFAFAACTESGGNGGDKHAEHDYTWTVETPATCTDDGVERGTCSCGDTTTRPISSKNGHEYGDWKIITMPSADSSGKAQKVCANDTALNHVLEVELPAFDRKGKDGYSSFKEDGHFVTFTYAHESGDITATTVASVKDAITLAAENKSAVVSGYSDAYFDYKIYGTKSSGKITYEFGEDRKFIHVKDNVVDGREHFYDLNDDGSMFAVYKEWKSISKDGEESESLIYTNYQDVLNMKEATPEMMDGFGFFFTWLNGDHKEYGVENFLNYIYNEYFYVNANQDAAASVNVRQDGTLLYKLSVSVHSTLNIDLLNKIDVEFTLDENNVLKTADVKCRTWNNPVMDAVTNLWSVPEGSDYVVMDQYSVVQETEREAGAETPANPFNLEDMYITSYDMVLGGHTLEEGASIEVDADTLSVINLENIQPAETFNLNFDEMTVTLTDSEGNVKTCVSSATDLKDGDILAQILTLRSYDGETITVNNVLQIKSLLAGEFTLTIKSEKLTKTLKLTVNTIAPSEFGASVYEYNPMKDVWDIDNIGSEFTVYTGQSFNFTSYVAHPFYEETGFNLSVSRGEDANIASDYTCSEATIDSVKVKNFVATVAGDYTLTLTNLKQNAEGNPVTTELTVHVVPAPEMSDVLNGKYFNIDDGFELTFVPSAEGAVEGEATLRTQVGGKNETSTVLTYGYDSASGVTLAYKSGALNTYTFNLEFDDAYNMFLKYVTAMGTTRKIYLYNVIPNLIEGTYRITNASSNAVKLVVNVEGKYSIVPDVYEGVFYGIFDNKTDRQIGANVHVTGSIVVDLQIGQYLKVWSVGSTTGTAATQYTITYVPAEESETQ